MSFSESLKTNKTLALLNRKMCRLLIRYTVDTHPYLNSYDDHKLNYNFKIPTVFEWKKAVRSLLKFKKKLESLPLNFTAAPSYKPQQLGQDTLDTLYSFSHARSQIEESLYNVPLLIVYTFNLLKEKIKKKGLELQKLLVTVEHIPMCYLVPESKLFF